MYVYEIKQKVLDLRKEGYSYTYISKLTGIVKSTLSEWLTNVPFKPNQYTLDTIGKARTASGLKKHLIKVESLEKAKVQAKKDIGKLSKRDLFLLGLGVYIGEGTKSFDSTRITNADPKIIKFSIRWLKEVCGLETKNLRIRMHLYPDNNEKNCRDFWSKETGIPTDQFHKSIIDHRENKKINKKGKLPFGTVHLSIKGFRDKRFGVNLHRLILAWINEVLC
jgi:hypothetical protein